MSRRDHQYLDVYCSLPHEFLIAYPQPRSSVGDQQKKKRNFRNTNALERTLSVRLSKYKPKNFLDPRKRSKNHDANEMHTSRRRMINKIMSIDSSNHQVELYLKKELARSTRHYHPSEMADGDKKHTIDRMHDDIIRLVPYKPTRNNRSEYSSALKNPVSRRSSARIDQSLLPLNRISTWRKLQANITASHYDHIQHFQRERQEEDQRSPLSAPCPVMLSPSIKQSEIETSQGTNVTSVSSNSTTARTDPHSNHRITRSINVDQLISNDNDDDSNRTIPMTNSHQSEASKESATVENEVKLLDNDSLTNISLANSFQTASLHEIENIEEFQPLLELVSPSQVPSILLNDIVSSLFPTISAPFTSSVSSNIHPLVIRSEHHNADHISQIPYMSFDDTSNMPELLLIGSPSTLTSTLIQSDFNSAPSRKVHSLLESIEELCLLIRQLLDRELPGQKVTSLQATIANQLAILLSYLAIPNNEKIIPNWRTENTMEKMTSTEEDLTSFQKSLFVTNGTQTDLVWNILLNDSIPQSMNVSFENIHSEKVRADDAMKFTIYKSPSISENEREKMIDIALSSQRGTSQTELASASVTLHLPGRRLHHALSDTYIQQIHHHQEYSSSYHRLISFSETTVHSLMHGSSTKEKTKHLLERIAQKFQHYIELESSNTCLEGSTEFTPDFLLTTINNSKPDDDDQTEQFGIDTEKQDDQIDTIPLIINQNEEKIDTLTFNSTEKENCDSLEIDMEQDNNEHSLFNSFDIHRSNEHSNNELNNSSSLSLNDNRVSPIINQLNQGKYFYQALEIPLNTYQWKVPISPRKTNSIDLIYEKRTAKMDFKSLKIRSNSNHGINLIGKQVRIKSNPSSCVSIPTNKSLSNQEQLKKLSILNYNNNCKKSDHSGESLGVFSSIIDTQLSSNSNASLCSFDSDTLERNNAKSCSLLMNRPALDGQTQSTPSHLSDVTDKLDSNIIIAQSLLNMLEALNANHNNHSSSVQIDSLHMYIRQFLIEFDVRVRLGRERNGNMKKKHILFH